MIKRCDLVPQYLEHKDEIDAAIGRVLHSGRYILGEEVDIFESEFASYLGVKYSVGVASGTDGLTLALIALGISEGDEVITTPFTSTATTAAIINSGAMPVYVDISPETYLIDIDKIPDAITPKTKAIIPVHIFGNVVDIRRIRALIGKSIPIIEDACQSHGSTINGNYAGSLGTMGVFSFYPTKNLGAHGDGGMVVTNDLRLKDILMDLRMGGTNNGARYIMKSKNSRLDELQAAILRIKLKYLDVMNSKRNTAAQTYQKGITAGFFKYQLIPENIISNYHLFAGTFDRDRNAFLRYLKKNEIESHVYYEKPQYNYLSDYFTKFDKFKLPAVEELCEKVIALPMYPEINTDTLNKVIEVINNYND